MSTPTRHEVAVIVVSPEILELMASGTQAVLM
jgi:hypothetical protein